MIKKLLLALLILFTIPVCAETVAPETDNLFFNDEVVKTAIVEFVPEDKQESVANLYEELMNQTTGQISIEKLFIVCRVAGFNTYRVDGFNKCRQFIEKLVADSELLSGGLAGGFCPGLREDGTNPNNLRSITDQTRVGDFCASTQIAAGEVIFNGIRRGREEYACTCLATACLPGFSFNNGVKTVSGMCQTIIANENGQCLREEHAKSPQNDNTQKCKDFCAKRYDGKGCSFTSVVMQHSTGKCICNPNQNEVNAAANSMKNAEKQRLANLPYYEVCGAHRGKSGGREICEDKIFNWTNVGQLNAAGLAQEFARVRYGDTIHCDTKYRKSGNDDWIKCVSTNSGNKTYYEFKFDDVKESIDADIKISLTIGICAIHNLSSTAGFGCKSSAIECSGKLAQSAQQFGYSTTYRGNICVVSDRRLNPDDAEEKLAKIDGIDNRVFFHGIQIQGSQTIVNKLETYIIGQGKTVDIFTCDYGTGKINASGILGNSDDILRCYLNGQPIDFVFDDFSESWLYVQEAGESGIQCIVNGGVYQGSNCHGLSQTQCTQMDVAIKKEFPGISGTKWENGMCVLRDARQAEAYDIMVNVGVGIVAAADCVLLTHTGCVILAVELAGLATEISTQIAIGGRAADFIKESIQCKSRECAKHTLTNLTGKVLSVKSSLKPQDLHAVDSELARLVGLLEPEDLSQDVPSAEWEDIVRQLGGDPTDAGGTALVVANKIGLVMQFASIGTSALRLTGRAIAALGAKSARMSNIGTAMVRAANNADGVRAAAAAAAINDAANAAGNTANAAGDASRAASNAANAAENARVFNNVEDAGRAFASGSDEAVEFARQNINAGEIRDLMRRAREAGFECTDCGGDVLRFTKRTVGATPPPAATGATSARMTANAATASPIDDILGASGRRATLRPGSGNSLGQDYYRIIVNDSDDIPAVISRLQNQGYYVGANMTSDGQKFLGVSKQNIFGAWDNASGNFLRSSPPSQYSSEVIQSLDNISRASVSSFGRINGNDIRLVDLPTNSGGVSPIGNLAGRAVVVVDYNGRKLPFYVSSGQAGKDAIGISSGKWYPLQGIGEVGGWFNKFDDMGNSTGIRVIDEITDMLNQRFDPSELKEIALGRAAGRIPNIEGNMEAARIINSEFKNGVVQNLIPNGRGGWSMTPSDRALHEQNYEMLKKILF